MEETNFESILQVPSRTHSPEAFLAMGIEKSFTHTTRIRVTRVSLPSI